MTASATPVALEEIQPWREAYRLEMNCQIVHDSLHARPGWSQAHMLLVDGASAGYGSVVMGGPWTGKPSIFELFIEPRWRPRAFDLFEALLRASGACAMDVQTNDALLSVMLHAYAVDIAVDRLLFHESVRTSMSAPDGCVFRAAAPGDAAQAAQRQSADAGEWVVAIAGEVAAVGGVATHYNPPYADIYYEVHAPFRRQGVGAFLAQELARVCRHKGLRPCARCRPDNLASLRTLARAGFAAFGLILTGALRTGERAL